MKIKRLVILGAVMATAGAWSNAYASLYFTPAGASVPDGAVSAEASVTLGNGTMTIVLTDLLQNPTSVGQTLSGFEFHATGTSGSPSLISSSAFTTSIQ